MVDQHDGTPTATGDERRHHARGASSYDSDIKYMGQFRVPATKNICLFDRSGKVNAVCPLAKRRSRVMMPPSTTKPVRHASEEEYAQTQRRSVEKGEHSS
ncbi:MAG: hypothetical protein K0M47_11720, partial [Rhizobium sp.]|nr:hypothetical protein [Rhizobium sp.]